MKPYEKDFILEKLKEYNKKIKPKKIGNHEIRKRKYSKNEVEGYLYTLKEKCEGEVLELKSDDKYWMQLSLKEIESTYFVIKNAKGKVGVVGLGIGYTVEEMAKKEEVKEILVYETSEDVINLYKSNFKENPKIKILNEDAFKAKKENFDYFFVDIYEYKLTEKVVKDYKFFNKHHNIEEYVFWGVEHFLLSCSYEEIIWVYIPELWMEMSKKSYEGLQSGDYINGFNLLDSKKVSNILKEFKEILNSDME